MKRQLRALIVSLAIACFAHAVQAGDSPEMERYFADTRAWGMGEIALMTLRTVASFTTGGSTVTFVRVSSDGGYVPSYQSTSCPARNADSLTLRDFRQAVASRIDPEVHALHVIADADSSGFVTTSEATTLRGLIEFGYLVDFLRGLGVSGPAGIAEAAQIDAAAVAQRIPKYNGIAAKLNALRQTPIEARLPVLKANS